MEAIPRFDVHAKGTASAAHVFGSGFAVGYFMPVR